MKKYLFAALMLFTATAHADICSQKVNLSTAPSTPLRSVTNGWFQWLNAGTASCSGSSSHLTCTKSGITYTFDYICDASHCYVEAYDFTNHWRNEAIMNTGDVWGWTWNGGKQGYLQMSCQVIDAATTVCTYTTCD